MTPCTQTDLPEPAEGAADPSSLPPHASEDGVDAAEANILASELADAFGGMVRMYREYHKLSAEEAVRMASETSPACIDRALNIPPEEVSWFDLDALAQHDAAKALKRWEQIKQAAREEIGSGHRAARAVEHDGGPWERARYLAVRSELREAYRPRNAAERLLVDQLAQWQVLLWRWQEALTVWTACASYGPRRAKKGEPYETMRLSGAEALDRAAAKVERIHHLYLRTLKALQEQRRLRRPNAVRRADRVSVTQMQVNVLPVGEGYVG